MTGNSIDNFEDVSAWMPVASGLVELAISREAGTGGSAMRLDFDFKGGGGFVVARRPIALTMPESWVLVFEVRGCAPLNKLEIKLADPTGRNVWWFHRDAYEFPAEWRTVRIRSSEIEFAWGPAGGGTLREVGAVEIAIAAPPGGTGSVWFADLRLEDHSFREVPIATASSARPGHAAQNALDDDASTTWRSAPGDGAPWWAADFRREREYGGLIVDWENGHAPRRFEVQTSDDALTWTTRHAATQAAGPRSYVSLPGTMSRHLRLNLIEAAGAGGFGIARVEVALLEFSKSVPAFFHHVAANEPDGAYPKYLLGRQTCWSPIGLADGSECALMNEEGMVEVDRGSFSVEPFLYVDEQLVTWADATVSQELENGSLPIPSSVWRASSLVFTTTAFASRCRGDAVLFLRYRVHNEGESARRARLFAVCRPFQVTPPWQAFGKLGGVSEIAEIDGDANVVWINRRKAVLSLSVTSGFGASAFEQACIADTLRAGNLPPHKRIVDESGFAAGGFRFDFELAAGSAGVVFLAAPFGNDRATQERVVESLRSEAFAAQEFGSVVRDWEAKLGRVGFTVPPVARAHVDTLRSAAAHILVQRDGPALQPGSRRYTRSWIRDGAIMAAALLRIGCSEEAKEFVRWYARFQGADGSVPCCVDRGGVDPLVEHDSHGELIFAVAECFRFTADREFLTEAWPAVAAAVAHIERLRATRLGSEYEAADKRARRGLLPESASHEGYLAHPVHSYWDDFWAVRGLGDAAMLAQALGQSEEARRIGALRESFGVSLRTSIDITMADRKIDYVPGSVEWADFDPTATANAVSLLDQLDELPRAAIERTYEIYLEGFRRRHDGLIDWSNYTPYEIRNIAALERLGWRDAANELLEYFLADRRPAAWNQWPEIAWRDPASPGHIGDMPHAWIGAEYILALRDMFVFEREAKRELVLAAGVPSHWLDGDGIAVRDLPTYFGRLSYGLRRTASDTLVLELSGELSEPAPQIVIQPPLPHPLVDVEVSGRRPESFDEGRVTLSACPATVVMRHRPV